MGLNVGLVLGWSVVVGWLWTIVQAIGNLLLLLEDGSVKQQW